MNRPVTPVFRFEIDPPGIPAQSPQPPMKSVPSMLFRTYEEYVCAGVAGRNLLWTSRQHRPFVAARRDVEVRR